MQLRWIKRYNVFQVLPSMDDKALEPYRVLQSSVDGVTWIDVPEVIDAVDFDRADKEVKESKKPKIIKDEV